jgi:hypothetical protein
VVLSQVFSCHFVHSLNFARVALPVFQLLFMKLALLNEVVPFTARFCLISPVIDLAANNWLGACFANPVPHVLD